MSSQNSDQHTTSQNGMLESTDGPQTNGVHDEEGTQSNGTMNGVDSNTENNSGSPGVEEQPERELTQTDHLNKKLLSSFLNRINTAGFPVSAPPGEQEENQDFSDKEDEPENGRSQIIPTN